jgi:hypothetical protein
MMLNNLPQVMVDVMYTDLELNEEIVNDSVEKLKGWLYMQPHLPHVNGKYNTA